MIENKDDDQATKCIRGGTARLDEAALDGDKNNKPLPLAKMQQTSNAPTICGLRNELNWAAASSKPRCNDMA